MADLHEITRYLDDYLRIGQINDYPDAFNGLQLQNGSGTVTKIAAAVDARLMTVVPAASHGVNLLLVHHGLFWGGPQPVTGLRYELWAAAVKADLAVYSAHLPLDVHPEVGNNARLCATLGLEDPTPFFEHKGCRIGLRGRVNMRRRKLAQQLELAVGGPVRVCPGGMAEVEQIGVITGGAGAEVRAVAAEGVDTFITGEGPHWTHALAEELGINILYGGHYATETFGVKALAAHLGERFGLPWEFIDHPTGL